MRSGYQELGLELFELGEENYQWPKKPPMAEEKRENGEGYLIKLLLEESLGQKRNEMMDNFSHILQ
jgi:hypothetical protein